MNIGQKLVGCIVTSILVIGAMGVPGVASAGIGIPFFSKPYKNQPAAYYTQGDQVLTADKVTYQDTVVLPRCTKAAGEVVPSEIHLALGFGWNGGIGNGAAAGANIVTQAGVLGVALPASVPAIIAGGAAAGAVTGFVSGINNRGIQVWSVRNGCIAQDATGLHMIPPSEGKAIKKGTMAPKPYGPSQMSYRNQQDSAATTTSGANN